MANVCANKSEGVGSVAEFLCLKAARKGKFERAHPAGAPIVSGQEGGTVPAVSKKGSPLAAGRGWAISESRSFSGLRQSRRLAHGEQHVACMIDEKPAGITRHESEARTRAALSGAGPGVLTQFCVQVTMKSRPGKVVGNV
jgi:hypothetical protein